MITPGGKFTPEARNWSQVVSNLTRDKATLKSGTRPAGQKPATPSTPPVEAPPPTDHPVATDKEMVSLDKKDDKGLSGLQIAGIVAAVAAAGGGGWWAYNKYFKK